MEPRIEEGLRKGADHREKGNTFFKNGEFVPALTQYHHALLHLRTLGGMQPPEDVKKRTNEEMIKVYNNMSAVLSKQEKWARVLECSKKVLEMDSENMKAKFRQGQAHARLGNIDEARELLSVVAARNPDDALVKNELQLLKKAGKHQDKALRDAYRKMFA
ncbi:hypothetical protein BCR43DRAFT_511416 [Syncephalastrum racemosum]|uniref:Uncharacterized protein n=1 Tax=Syncephalastrum racemosum TaxID=13706 RepID=A0A1X2HNF7_SYNRA|nr:hypothetical protein BCR43DRAFT_511416 [Syncephalastrum racemosum]